MVKNKPTNETLKEIAFGLAIGSIIAGIITLVTLPQLNYIGVLLILLGAIYVK